MSVNSNDNKGLFAKLGNPNVSDINLSTANLVVGKNVTGKSTSGAGALSMAVSDTGISSAFYDAFDDLVIIQ